MTFETIPIQTLPTGDALHVMAYRLGGTNPGPRAYLQANLHGPEILGSAILLQLIADLRANEPSIHGSLTIVPCANPIGIQSQTYGYLTGRWNTQNGKNWNRVFDLAKQNANATTSVEETLAQTLLSIARGHDIVLDLHTSGAATVPHLFVPPTDSASFNPLGAFAHVLVRPDDYYGAFDESCARVAASEGRAIRSGTWEVGCHGAIDPTALQAQGENLKRYLASIGILRDERSVPPKPPGIVAPLSSLQTIHAPSGGYLVWDIDVGTRVESGQPYARIFHVRDASVEPLVATTPFTLLIRHPLQAPAQGQEIGEAVFHE